jgi:hypothetical protein
MNGQLHVQTDLLPGREPPVSMRLEAECVQTSVVLPLNIDSDWAIMVRFIIMVHKIHLYARLSTFQVM